MDSNWTTRTITSDDKRRIGIMADRPYGVGSEALIMRQHPMMKSFGGGTILNCVKGVYGKDFMVEQRLANLRLEDQRQKDRFYKIRHKAAALIAQKRMQAQIVTR